MSHFGFYQIAQAVSYSKVFELYLGGTWFESFLLHKKRNNNNISNNSSISLTRHAGNLNKKPETAKNKSSYN
jgi:hypothetical protein